MRFHLPVRDACPRGHGHRRRVRGDQLGHRRDDPRQVPGPGGPGRQRHVLGWRHHWDHRHAVPAQPRRRGVGLADRLPGRPGPRAGDYLRPEAPPRISALADHARQTGGGGRVDRGDRARRGGDQRRAAAGGREQGTGDPADRAVRVPAAARGPVPALPQARGPRLGPDDHAVVPVQRDLLHVRARPRVLLPREPEGHRLLLLRVRRRQRRLPEPRARSSRSRSGRRPSPCSSRSRSSSARSARTGTAT